MIGLFFLCPYSNIAYIQAVTHLLLYNFFYLSITGEVLSRNVIGLMQQIHKALFSFYGQLHLPTVLPQASTTRHEPITGKTRNNHIIISYLKQMGVL